MQTHIQLVADWIKKMGEPLGNGPSTQATVKTWDKELTSAKEELESAETEFRAAETELFKLRAIAQAGKRMEIALGKPNTDVTADDENTRTAGTGRRCG